MASILQLRAIAGGAAPFYGNPNVAINSIDTSGGIVSSRTSGDIPAFVHVSASGITATGTSYPYRDLDYSWNFGDPNSTETFTNPVTGATVNSNNNQHGPEAVHVYRVAGSYTITLTIRGKNGGSYTITSATMLFIANAYTPSSGPWYFDSNYDGSGGASNGTITRPYTDWTTLKTKSNDGGSQIFLKYGSTFVSTGANNDPLVGQGGARWDAYGTSTDGKPIISAVGLTVGTFGAITFSQQFVSVADCVYSNIVFQSDNGIPIRFKCLGPNSFSDIYFDNCEAVYIFHESTANFDNFGLWGHKCLQQIPQGNTSSTFMIGTAQNWVFIFGCLITCDGAQTFSVAADHWVYPDMQTHGVYKWTEFGPGNAWFAINGNHHGDGDYHYHLIGENSFHGTTNTVELSVSQPGVDSATFDDTVIEGNLVYGCNGSDNTFSIIYCLGLTVRDNYVSKAGANYMVSIGGNSSDIALDVYRNNFYPGGGGAGFINSGSNNTHRIQISDNTVWNTSASAIVVRVNTANDSWTGQGSLINRDSYYVPNDSTYNSLNGGSSNISFATWQAAGFDVNGSELVSAPSWPDPANGDFGQY